MFLIDDFVDDELSALRENKAAGQGKDRAGHSAHSQQLVGPQINRDPPDDLPTGTGPGGQRGILSGGKMRLCGHGTI